MIPAKGWEGKKIAVLGLARSGLAGVRSLIAGRAQVIAWDEKKSPRELARAYGAFIQDLTQIDWREVRGLFLSPGIPHHLPHPHPVAQLAQDAHVPLINDIDILYQSVKSAQFIGVTGTNGKSTTTALITHLLNTAGLSAQAGGNIGIAALDLEPFLTTGIYVLELSSYQLERLQKIEFDSALLLNIKPDHLDRHGGIEEYAKAKELIFNRVKNSKAISYDDDYCKQICLRQTALSSKALISFSCLEKSTSLRVEEGILIDDSLPSPQILNLKATSALFAEHNWQNALGAYAALKYLSIKTDLLIKGFETFPGLEHRQEPVLTHNNILYINDSKATNVDSALQALKAFDNIYWILGGKPKQDDFRQVLPFSSKITKAYVIGEAKRQIMESLSNDLDVFECETLQQAVLKATEDARKNGNNPVVLLSPACASFDQFKDFEERGQVFKRLVKELAQ